MDSNDPAYADIKWTTTLASLIWDDFVLQDEYATNHITLIDALSHRTGMPRHDVSRHNNDVSIKGSVRHLRYLPLHNEIRMQWEYCNLMFTAVSHAIESTTGLPMRKIFREWIWEPLGMEETFYSLDDALELEKKSDGEVAMARGHMWDTETKDYVEVPFSDIPPENGAGGIITNVLSYAPWVRQFLYPSNPDNPISPAAIKAMIAAHMPVPESWKPYKTHTYGLGLETATYRGQVLVGHQGAIAGYMAEIRWLPELEWRFVALQNSYSYATYAVLFRLMDEFLGSVGAQGEGFAMREKARELESEKKATLEKGKGTVYPGAPDIAAVDSALPLTAYEGVYYHPAYNSLTIAIASSSAESGSQQESLDAPLSLVARGSEKSYLDMSWTFHHVSGEHWWVYFRYGPGFFATDGLLKANFEIGVDGKVSGLRLQVEPAIEELAWFKSRYDYG